MSSYSLRERFADALQEHQDLAMGTGGAAAVFGLVGAFAGAAGGGLTGLAAGAVVGAGVPIVLVGSVVLGAYGAHKAVEGITNYLRSGPGS